MPRKPPEAQPSAGGIVQERIVTWLEYSDDLLKKLLSSGSILKPAIQAVDSELEGRITALERKYLNPVYRPSNEEALLNQYRQLRAKLSEFVQ